MRCRRRKIAHKKNTKILLIGIGPTHLDGSSSMLGFIAVAGTIPYRTGEGLGGELGGTVPIDGVTHDCNLLRCDGLGQTGIAIGSGTPSDDRQITVKNASAIGAGVSLTGLLDGSTGNIRWRGNGGY